MINGDLGLLEGIDESDIVFLESETFNTTGVKISYVIPKDKKLVIVGGKVTGSGTNIIDLNYADRSLTTFPIEVLRGYPLHGDGIRKMEIVSVKASGNFKAIFFGYLADISQHIPLEPVNISATSPLDDTIEIKFNAPLDNGGLPITQYNIKRSETINGTYELLEKVITRAEDDVELDIIYLDENLENNKEYFYKINAINTQGEGTDSGIISATTEIGHPGRIPTLTVTPFNSTQNKLFFEFPSNSGGGTLVGIKIERSLLPDSEFATIVENTENLNTEYIDTGLDTNTTYYYMAYAINQAGKLSLMASDVDFGTPIYDPPTNLTIQTIENNTIAQLNWDEPIDTNSLEVQRYIIYRRLGGEIDFSIIGETIDDITSYDDLTTMANRIYDYMVIGIIDGEETPQSVVQSISVSIRPPTTPTAFVAASVLETQIDLIWGAPLDDGGSVLTDYGIIYSKNSDFSNSVEISTGLVNTHSVINLDQNTKYYFKIYAKNGLYDSVESPIINATTTESVYGGSQTDLIISVGEIVTIGDGEYRNIINEGTLIITSGIIRAESYDNKFVGNIKVAQTGCAGGIGGITIPGAGGSGNFFDSNPGEVASKIVPTNAIQCTDLDAVSTIIDYDIAEFNVQFKNYIIGGKGSDGTPAETSGDGGYSGKGYNLGGQRAGKDGGTGGKAADGVNGVSGNGKLAMYVKNIISGIIIDAKGNNGNDGNKGTAAESDRISCTSYGCGGWTAGSVASANGTMGSKGSQGGIVFLVYSSIPNIEDINTDTSGGLGGFGGEVADSLNEHTTIRANSGNDGVFVSRIV